jgi:NADPH:quinone reductase-like Zn-dependent oxidoreductase
MQALHIEDGFQLKIKQVPIPDAKPGQALIRVQAAALNHRDVWITKGL